MEPATDPWVEVVADTFRAGQRSGMVGPGDVREHIERSRAMASELPEPARLLDLGSGAGIPGLVLAGCWPDADVRLLDSAQRRIRVLDEAITQLAWAPRVQTLHARAEDAGRDPAHRDQYDLVTARSFGPPAVVAECAAALVRVGGLVVVTEPPDATGDRWDPGALADLGLEAEGVRAGLMHLRCVQPVPERFPRRSGVPRKRPLF